MTSREKEEQQALYDLRSDFKFRLLEKIIKQFFTESLEAVLLKQQDRLLGAENLSTITDIAKRFKVSKTTIHNWMQRGIIHGSKVGKNRYFTEEEIRSIIFFLKR
ncbi:MAG TPA: helix-turn-helix domain-containing protein [Mucilaginibacter sp.]|jgi:DNA invertase Pin-like site-specific DNA recombinase